MRKFTIDLAGVAPPGHAKFRPWRIASMFLIAVIFIPLAVECGRLCHAQWSTILGNSSDVPTPILNWTHESFLIIRQDLRNSMAPLWSQIPSAPKSVLILGAVTIALGILVLRMSGRHGLLTDRGLPSFA